MEVEGRRKCLLGAKEVRDKELGDTVAGDIVEVAEPTGEAVGT